MWKKFLNLPSQERRRHIRLFARLHLTDEQDVALRAFTAFRIWHPGSTSRLAKPTAPTEPR
jgi:hypothetical protein